MPKLELEVDAHVTVGELEELARSMRKRLRISFASDGNPRRPEPTAPAEAPARRKTKGRRRRKLSPEARAALARNLEKARAAQAAKRRKAAKGASA